MNTLSSRRSMSSFLKLSLLAFLLMAAASPCFALRGVRPVTPDMAREMGIVIRATAAGPDGVWLEMEFKPEDKLKAYSHVEMEIREGDKMLMAYATMGETRTSSGSVVVRFMANRGYLDKIILIAVTGFPSNFSNNELRVKDFVDLEKLH